MKAGKSYYRAQNAFGKSGKIPDNFAEYAELPDVEIWQRFIAGDWDVLIYIYHEYTARLLRFGLQFAPRELVKDAIQDLFLYLKERKKQPQKIQNIPAYLYKSLYRIIRKKVEYGQRLAVIGEDQVKEWRIVLASEISLINQEHKNEQRKKLQLLLDKLSARQRQALLLYYYEGFTYREIAEIMDLKDKSSVRKLVHRAIDMLRDGFTART